LATNSRRRSRQGAPAERRDAVARIAELRSLAPALLRLARAGRSAPLLYLELIGIDRVAAARRAAALAACKREVAAALRASVGTVLRASDVVAAGPSAHWFVALLAGRSVSVRASAGVSDADLGLVAGRLQAAVRERLRSMARSGAISSEIGVISGWTVLDPVSRERPLDELRQAIRGAAVVARVEAARAAVLASVTHELRTPLTAIVGYAERLRDDRGLTPAQRARYYGIVADEGRRLHRLVESLIDIGAWTAGKLKLERQPTELRELAARAWSAIAPRAAGRHVRLTLRGRARAGVDRERFEQVLINLLDNAVRHSPDGGRVSIAIGTTTARATLVVEDEGPGFSAAAAHAFGAPFASEADGRAGLGLSIARLLVEAHGGELAVRRTRRRGARLEIRVPADVT
jgi:two-component system, OmpR family, sensor histidine kinase ResE